MVGRTLFCFVFTSVVSPELSHACFFFFLNEEMGSKQEEKAEERIREGFSLTQTVDAYALAWGEVHHLALEGEVIAFLGAAHDALAGRADDLDAEVVELEGIICGSGSGCGLRRRHLFFFSSFLVLFFSWR